MLEIALRRSGFIRRALYCSAEFPLNLELFTLSLKGFQVANKTSDSRQVHDR